MALDSSYGHKVIGVGRVILTIRFQLLEQYCSRSLDTYGKSKKKKSRGVLFIMLNFDDKKT